VELYLLNTKEDVFRYKKALNKSSMCICIGPEAKIEAYQQGIFAPSFEETLGSIIKSELLQIALKSSELLFAQFDQIAEELGGNDDIRISDFEQMTYLNFTMPIFQYSGLKIVVQKYGIQRIFLPTEYRTLSATSQYRFQEETSFNYIVECIANEMGLEIVETGKKFISENLSTLAVIFLNYFFRISVSIRIKSQLRNFLDFFHFRRKLKRTRLDDFPINDSLDGVLYLEPFRSGMSNRIEIDRMNGHPVCEINFESLNLSRYRFVLNHENKTIQTLSISKKEFAKIELLVKRYCLYLDKNTKIFVASVKDFGAIDLTKLIKQKIIRNISHFGLHSLINLALFRKYFRDHEFIIRSFEVYNYYLKPCARDRGIANRWIMSLHGPRYNHRQIQFRNEWAESLYLIDGIEVKGPMDEQFFEYCDRPLQSRKESTNLYRLGKTNLPKIEMNIPTEVGKKNILGIGPRINSINNTATLYHENISYLENFLKSMAILNDLSGPDISIFYKPKPTDISEGLYVVPINRLFPNITVLKDKLSLTKILSCIEFDLVIIDSLGSSLLEALSFGCNVAVFNRYADAFELRSQIEQSVHYFEDSFTYFEFLKDLNSNPAKRKADIFSRHYIFDSNT